MEKQFNKCRKAGHALAESTHLKLFLAVRTKAARDALQPKLSGPLSNMIGGIKAGYDTLLAKLPDIIFDFTNKTVQHVTDVIESLKATQDALRDERDLAATNLHGYRSLPGVLLLMGLYSFLGCCISLGDFSILAGSLVVVASNLLLSGILALGISICLWLLPVISNLTAERASTPLKRRIIHVGSFALAAAIFAGLVATRRYFDYKTGNEQPAFTYIFLFLVNFLSYFIQHQLCRLLLLKALKDVKDAWQCFVQKNKIKALERKINRVSKQISEQEEELRVLLRAEEEILLLEETISRYWLETVFEYKNVYALNAKHDIPGWLNDTAPDLLYIYRGNRPVTAQVSQPERFSRTPIGFKVAALTVIGFSSCTLATEPPTHFVGFVKDITFEDTVKITGPLLLSQAGFDKPINDGAEIRISSISAREFSVMHRLSLKAVSDLKANVTIRPGTISDFSHKIDSALRHIEPPNKEITGQSLIFHSVANMVSELNVCNTCTDAIIILQTDLMENSPGILNSYTELSKLTNKRDDVLELLHKQYPLKPISKPLKVIIVHTPAIAKQRTFGLMLKLLEDYLARSGPVLIEVVPSL